MANMILRPSSDFVSFDAINCTNENSSYPWTNVEEWEEINKHYRSANITSAMHGTLDFGGATSIAAVVLYNVNFTSVVIEGNATDSWSSPSFSETKTISKDDLVGRYKGFFTLTNFNYRYMRIGIDPGSTTDGESYFKIEAIIPLSSATPLTKNPGPEYPIQAYKAGKTIEYMSGRIERAVFGLKKQYRGELSFTDKYSNWDWYLQDLNEEGQEGGFIFYENGYNSGGTDKVYLVRMVEPIKITTKTGHFSLDTINMVEII